MRKHPTSCCSLISAQERAGKGHKEHRANNEQLQKTGHTAKSLGAFFFSGLQYFVLRMSSASGIYKHMS